MSKLVQAGGTAKTTTTAALGVLLSRRGIPVHLVDMDPQASLTRAFGLTDLADRLYNALSNRAGLPVEMVSEGLTLTPSTVELCHAETELLTEPGGRISLEPAWKRHGCPITRGFFSIVRRLWVSWR